MRLRPWMIPLAAALVVGMVGWWAQASTERSLKEQLAAQFETIVEADVAALTVWLDGQERAVQQFAARPEFRRAVLALADVAREPSTPPDVLRGSAELATIRGLVNEALEPGQSAEGFVILDRAGKVLGAEFDYVIGRSLAAKDADRIGKVLAGSAIVLGPFPFPVQSNDATGSFDAPALFVATAVHDGAGRGRAVFARRLEPGAGFSRSLQVARFGSSGETYAFNAEGVVISELRGAAELRRLGLLPNDRPTQTALAIALRDPGGNLLEGFEPDVPPAAMPLTRMAAEAISGRSGVDVNGYRDLRGVPVVGAWRWLPAHDLGVAAEADASEAFSTLLVFRRAFWSLVGLLGLAALGGLVYALLFRNLQRRVAQAEKVGQYTLEEKLGEGGMGTVYRARHAMLARPTAIKLLRSGETTPQLLARFEREVQLTSQLTNPNTIAIYDYGRTPDGVFYYAMEFLEGVTLDTLIEIDGPQPAGRVVHILRQVAGSLAEAHDIGLIHRDIKPANIMILARGGTYDLVKVLDFGLVREVHQSRDDMLTAVNTVPGTPHFMAPESIESPDAVDARADIYAVGAVAYYLITGTYLFDGQSAIQVMTRHVNDAPEPPSIRLGTPIDSGLERLILRMLSKDPAARPANGRELLATLSDGTVSHGLPWTERDAKHWWDTRSAPCRDAECADDESYEGALEVDLESRVSVA
ncbi:MAG TPA: serine/threonine protein kinase [Gemmatimonadales bacterium]|nr:serine/threonine protein kinase [Gemmatimonadales bacterium]